MERRKILEADWSPKNPKPLSEYFEGSGFKATWEHFCKCGEKHKWKARIADRFQGRNCPRCSGRGPTAVICPCKSLQKLCPELIKEWHPNKNLKQPIEISVFSNQKAWWICNKNSCEHPHEWKAIISSRTKVNGTNCPYCSGHSICPCNSLTKLRPDLAAEWHPTKNKINPISVAIFSNQKVWWKCLINDCEHHEWETTVSQRTAGQGCPYCSGHKACPCNSLARLRPDLLSEWHPTKNKISPDWISVSSGKKVWWRCQKANCEHHEWEAVVSSRNHGNNCPYCSGHKVCSCNSLATLRPDLAAEWHPTKNELSPEEVTIGSGKKAWWRCSRSQCKHHNWKADICSRTIGGNCPYCSGHKVCPCNSLATLRPDLAAEWHPTKNKLSAGEITVSSGKKFWWICDQKHEWETQVWNRTKKNGSGCPICSGSNGEKLVRKILEKMKLKFVREKIISYKECTKLRFDFYLPDHNVAIEFDGIQHFEPRDFFGGQKQFEKQKLYDSYKNAHCEENGISLVRIHYKDAEEIPALVDLAAEERDRPCAVRSRHYP